MDKNVGSRARAAEKQSPAQYAALKVRGFERHRRPVKPNANITPPVAKRIAP